VSGWQFLGGAILSTFPILMFVYFGKTVGWIKTISRIVSFLVLLIITLGLFWLIVLGVALLTGEIP
jgi:hypothetical protein